MTADTFDLSSYLSAHEKASERLRNRYAVLLLVCGALALFLVRIHSFESFPSELEYIDTQTESLNSTAGEIKAMEGLRERSREKALGEIIGELRSQYRGDLAATYCAVVDRGGSDSCPKEVDASLASESLSTADARAKISARKKELLVLGTGFHIPILNEVVEAQHVPLICSLLLVIVAIVVAATSVQWLSSLETLCAEARSAGVARKAKHLLTAQAGILTLTPGNRARAAVAFIEGLAYLVPLGLLLLLYAQHSYLFFTGKTPTYRSLSIPTSCLYASITIVLAIALAIAARSRMIATRTIRDMEKEEVKSAGGQKT